MDYHRISLDESLPEGQDRREDSAVAGLPLTRRPAQPPAAMDAEAFRSASERILTAINTVIDGKAEAATELAELNPDSITTAPKTPREATSATIAVPSDCP